MFFSYFSYSSLVVVASRVFSDFALCWCMYWKAIGILVPQPPTKSHSSNSCGRCRCGNRVFCSTKAIEYGESRAEPWAKWRIAILKSINKLNFMFVVVRSVCLLQRGARWEWGWTLTAPTTSKFDFIYNMTSMHAIHATYIKIFILPIFGRMNVATTVYHRLFHLY